MKEKIYLTIFQIDPDKKTVLATTFAEDQAFKIAYDFLNMNTSVKAEQVFVEEFIFKKTLKILDYQD